MLGKGQLAKHAIHKRVHLSTREEKNKHAVRAEEARNSDSEASIPPPPHGPPQPCPRSPSGETHLPSGEDPSGGSGVLTAVGHNPCRTHPPPTSSLGEAPLLGSVQPRSAARNFAIYEQGDRVPLALAASVLALPLSWGEQGGPKLVDPGGVGDPPAKAVPSRVSGPAGSSPRRYRSRGARVKGADSRGRPSLGAAGARLC